MKHKPTITALVLLAIMATGVVAHDTWVQVNAPVVRIGDVAYVDLMLGNHGNAHRDFKLIGKPKLETITLSAIAPDGSTMDLKSALIDQGAAADSGYYTARLRVEKTGLYMIAQTSDAVVSYAPLRSIKSGKTFVLACDRLDDVPVDAPGFDRALDHPLELIPQTNPIAPMSPGRPITVQLRYKGKPLPDARISFIPRGHVLAEGFDKAYERRTDADGMATFIAPEANQYLIVAHHSDDDSGEGYEGTKYSATLVVTVPAICPCCGR